MKLTLNGIFVLKILRISLREYKNIFFPFKHSPSIFFIFVIQPHDNVKPSLLFFKKQYSPRRVPLALLPPVSLSPACYRSLSGSSWNPFHQSP
jgi:hypothetical protein